MALDCGALEASSIVCKTTMENQQHNKTVVFYLLFQQNPHSLEVLCFKIIVKEKPENSIWPPNGKLPCCWKLFGTEMLAKIKPQYDTGTIGTFLFHNF